MKKFNYSDTINRYAAEHFKLFGKPISMVKKKYIKQFKKVFCEEDEHYMFEIFARQSMFNMKGINCPKCGEEANFTSDRWKRIDKMLRTKRLVRVEQDRQYTCSNCSFKFHPLAHSFYKNTNLDLRIYLFYLVITDDLKADLPVSSISRIFDISYTSAKRLVEKHKNQGGITKGDIDKVFDKGHDHWKVKLFKEVVIQYEKERDLQ